MHDKVAGGYEMSPRWLRRSDPPPGEPVVFDPVSVDQAVAQVRDGLVRGSGGLVVVLDRQALQPSPTLAATVVLPGSRAAAWANRLAGRSAPHRLRAAELVEAVCRSAAAEGRKVFLVGGAPGGPGIPSAAQRVAAVLGLRCRGLTIAGTRSAPAADTPHAWASVCADVVEAKPDLVLASAAPTVLQLLRSELPSAWLLGCTDLIDAFGARSAALGQRTASVLDLGRGLGRHFGLLSQQFQHRRRLVDSAADVLARVRQRD
jgi:hypothetical protein